MSEIDIHSNGRTLAGSRFLPDDQAPSGAGILFIHGAGSDKGGYGPRAEAACAAIGATCLTFDLGGHGGSDGRGEALSLRDHLEDCVSAFDALAVTDGVDLERIGICGASYGGYLAALMTSRREIRSLLLRAPALYPDDDFELAGGPGRSSVQTLDSAAVLRAISVYDGPTLIVESERDEVIPTGVVDAYLQASRQAGRVTIPHAGHQLTDPSWRIAFVDAIVSWFGETLRPRRRRAVPSAVA